MTNHENNILNRLTHTHGLSSHLNFCLQINTINMPKYTIFQSVNKHTTAPTKKRESERKKRSNTITNRHQEKETQK